MSDMRFRLYVLVAASMTFLGACGVEPTVTCENDDACFNGYRCDSVTSTCLRACDEGSASDCLASQFCDAPSGATEGVCRQDDGTSNSNNANDNNNNNNGG